MKKAGVVIIAVLLALILAVLGVSIFFGRSNIAYEQALGRMHRGSYTEAAQAFEQLDEYRDAAKYTVYCRSLAAAEKGDYAAAAANLATLGDFGDSSLRVVYYRACRYEAGENYEEAQETFGQVSFFLDAAERAAAMPEKIHERDYAYALRLEQAGNYQSAMMAFRNLGSYKDSASRAASCSARLDEMQTESDYQAALGLEEAGRDLQAVAAFRALGSYRDSATRMGSLQKKLYDRADAAEQASDFVTAWQVFTDLGDYADSATRAAGIRQLRDYSVALQDADTGSYSDALRLFRGLGDFQDSQEKARVLSVSQFSRVRSAGAGLAVFSINDSFGLINTRENIVTAPYWDEISACSQHLLRVRRNRYYGYMDEVGNLVIPCIYDDARDFDANGLAAVKTGKGWGVIDAKGAIVIPAAYSSVTAFSSRGWCIVQKGNYLGVLNTAGETVLEPEWTRIGNSYTGSWSNNVAKPEIAAGTTIQVRDANGAYWLMDSDLHLMGERGWDEISGFSEGYARVKDGSRYGYIDKKGQVVIQPAYQEADAFSKGLAMVRADNGFYGYIDATGEMVIPAIYDSAERFTSDTATVRMKNIGWLMIDRQGGYQVFDVALYTRAQQELEAGNYAAARDAFGQLGNYRDSAGMMKESTYREALALKAEGKVEDAYRMFVWSIPDYRDSLLLADQIYADILFDEGRFAEAWAIYGRMDTQYHTHDAEYQAMADSYAVLLEEGRYDEAIAAYTSLGGYGNSAEQIQRAYDGKYAAEYQLAIAMMDEGRYDEAVAVFGQLGEYSKAQEMVQECHYRKAAAAVAAGDRAAALAIYTRVIPEYKDVPQLYAQLCADQLFDQACYVEAYDAYMALDEGYRHHMDDFAAMYDGAVQLRAEGRFDEAEAAFTAIANYNDAAAQVTETKYQKAAALAAGGEFSQAISLYRALDGYSDSVNLQAQAEADKLYADGKVNDAYIAYMALDEGYRHHMDEYAQAYAYAIGKRAEGDFDEAVRVLSLIPDYEDATAQVTETKYQQAAALAAAGEYGQAIAMYKALDGYSDSVNLLAQAQADRLYAGGRIDEAYTAYMALDEGYRHHMEDYAALYDQAVQLRAEGRFDEAEQAFQRISGYSDAAQQVRETRYQQAAALAAAGEYDRAIALYDALGGYSDSVNLKAQANADRLFAQGKLAAAYDAYMGLGEGYRHHMDDFAAVYAQAEALQAAGSYDEAYDLYLSLGAYGNASAKLPEVGGEKALSLSREGRYLEAAEVYRGLGREEEAVQEVAKEAGACKQAGQYLEAAEVYRTLGWQDEADKAVSLAAQARQQAGDYAGATQLWMSLEGRQDSRQSNYDMAMALIGEGKWSEALAALGADMTYADATEQMYLLAGTASAARRYEVSVPAYTMLGQYKDSGMNLTMDTYAFGEQLYDAARYDEAAVVFAGMNGFSNTAERANQSRYAAAKVALETGNYADAHARFAALGTYSDSATMVKEADYRDAQRDFDEGRFEDALAKFNALKGYNDAEQKAKAVIYAIGDREFTNGNYAAAVDSFGQLGSYSDAQTRWKEARFARGMVEYNGKEYDKAITTFEELNGFGDSATMAKAAHYGKAQTLDEAGDVRGAYDEYVKAANYSDASFQMKVRAHTIGQALYLDNRYTEAVDWFEIADDYSDAKAQLYKVGQYFFFTQDYMYSMNAFKSLAGYEDAADYLCRIGQYYEMLPDQEKAYLAYEFAGDYGQAKEKAATISASLVAQAKKLTEAGRYTEAKRIYTSMARANAAWLGEIDRVEFAMMLQKATYVTIGHNGNAPVRWKVGRSARNQLDLVATRPLAKRTWDNARTSITGLNDSWLTADEKKVASIFFMSESDADTLVKHFSKEDFGLSNYDYVWVSTKDTGYHYGGTYYKTIYFSGTWFYTSSSGSNSKEYVLPAMHLKVNDDLFELAAANPYITFTVNGKAVSLTRTDVSAAERLPLLEEPKVVENAYTVSSSGYAYGFAKNTKGWYESGNKGKSSSYAMARITFTSTTGYIYLDCINYAETGDDYGIISKLDTGLATNNSSDSNFTRKFNSSSDNKSGTQTVKIAVPDTDEHTIYVKFIKDGSYNNYNDSLQFQVRFE